MASLVLQPDETSSNEIQKLELPPGSQLKNLRKKQKTKGLDVRKKRRHKPNSLSPKELPSAPECGHSEKGMLCNELNKEDINNFQYRFNENRSKVKQDIFILRHCAVSAPKRCRSKDGIQKKSMVVHYNVSTISAKLIPVCRTTFTSLLGIKSGRVQGVVNRYIQSKKIPTENRGGDRYSKIFQKKLQAVGNFLTNLPGSLDSCTRCGASKKILSEECDMRKLLYNYNANAPYDLRVVESYFRTVFTKHFNISFGIFKDKDKEHCYRCPVKRKTAHLTIKPKKEIKEEDDDIELKILEMSFPPGEHFLFAPIPASRNPIEEMEWKSGDELEYENAQLQASFKNGSHQQKATQNNDTQEERQEHHGDSSMNQMPILRNLLIRPATELEFHLIDSNKSQMPSNETQLHQLTTSQHGNLMNIHHIQQHNIENVQLQPQHHYIMHPSHHSLMDQGHPAQSVMHTFVNNHIIQNDHQTSNMTLNINTNHYVNLQSVQNLNPQQNLNQSLSGCEKQDYHFLSLPNHLVEPNGENTLQERQEGILFSQNEESNNLKPPNLKKNPFKCLPCKLTFSSQEIYQMHKKRHLDSKRLKCDQCGRHFVRSNSFQQHIRTHHDSKPFKCEKCGLSFSHRINLDIHESRHETTGSENSQNILHRCNICLKTFSSKDELNVHSDCHSKIVGPTELQVKMSKQCQICQEKFASRQALDIHMKSHRIEKNLDFNINISAADALSQDASQKITSNHYNSTTCGSFFNLSTDLHHQKQSHGESETEKFNCKFCESKFKSTLSLKRHSLIHSNGKPFKCPFCPRAFTREFCLNRHLKQHSKSKAYQCVVYENHSPDLEALNHHGKKYNEKNLHVFDGNYLVPISGNCITPGHKNKQLSYEKSPEFKSDNAISTNN